MTLITRQVKAEYHVTARELNIKRLETHIYAQSTFSVVAMAAEHISLATRMALFDREP
jgi:hypothetical protein